VSLLKVCHEEVTTIEATVIAKSSSKMCTAIIRGWAQAEMKFCSAFNRYSVNKPANAQTRRYFRRSLIAMTPQSENGERETGLKGR
jgi:hypothetical protein